MSTKVSLEDIRTDGGTQPRAALNNEMIREYTADLISGTRFPPVLVYYDGEIYWLTDGFHRFKAHEQAGFESINCEVNQGSRRDAILASVGVNAKHGLRRTNADKRRAVTTLLEDEEWGKWSDSEIARRCNVHQTFVLKMRKEISPMINIGENQERTYIDKHGNETTMDISKMKGGDKKEEAEEPKKPNKEKENKEESSTRTLGQEEGIKKEEYKNESKKTKKEELYDVNEEEIMPSSNKEDVQEEVAESPRRGNFAMKYARMAIMQLKEIQDDDPDREEAFDYVLDWINKNR